MNQEQASKYLTTISKDFDTAVNRELLMQVDEADKKAWIRCLQALNKSKLYTAPNVQILITNIKLIYVIESALVDLNTINAVDDKNFLTGFADPLDEKHMFTRIYDIARRMYSAEAEAEAKIKAIDKAVMDLNASRLIKEIGRGFRVAAPSTAGSLEAYKAVTAATPFGAYKKDDEEGSSRSRP